MLCVLAEVQPPPHPHPHPSFIHSFSRSDLYCVCRAVPCGAAVLLWWDGCMCVSGVWMTQEENGVDYHFVTMDEVR